MVYFGFLPPVPRGTWFWLAGAVLCCVGSSAIASPTLSHARWSNPSPHGNNVFSMAYSSRLQRGVQVTERGLIYYSDDLLNWIPRETGLNVALRSAAFMSNGRCVFVGESGTVAYADDLGTIDFLNPGQLNDGSVSDWLEGLAVSHKQCVAVGDAGTIYSSTNGIHWIRRAAPITHWLTAVAHGPGGFVAVGEQGAILQSEDGIDWINRSTGNKDWLGITYGSQKYMAVGRGGLIGTSANGTNWAVEQSGHTNDLWFVSIQDSSRLIGGTFELLLSEKNGPWKDQLEQTPFPAPVGTYYCALARTNFFLAAGRSGVLTEGYQASEGAPFYWLNAAPAVRSWIWDVTCIDDLHAAVGDRGVILTSEEGIHWDLELPPSAVTNQTLLGVGGDHQLLLAVGTQGSLIRSPNLTTNIVVTNVVGGIPIITNLTTSTLGIVWTPVEPKPTTNQLQGVTAGHGLYVVVGDNGELLTSPEGLVWTQRASETTELLSGVAAVGDGFVACGQNGTLLVGNPSGGVWQRVNSGSTDWLFRVRSQPPIAVVVGENGVLLTRSGDGTWLKRNAGISEFLTDITWVGDTAVVVGLNGTLRISTNYVDWSSLNPFTYRDFFAVTQNRGQLVMAGEDGAILRSRLFADTTPVDLIEFSRIGNTSSGTTDLLFLLGGKTDQRFTVEASEELGARVWQSGPYLEFRSGSPTLTYLVPQPLTNSPARQYFRPRLLP